MRQITFEGKTYDVKTEPANKRECYEIDGIYYDADTHLVAGTSSNIFPLLRIAKAMSKRAYKGKVRKTTRLTYEDHCTEIYRLCMQYKFSHGDDVIYAAVLHNYLEDAVRHGKDRETTIEWMKKTLGYSVTTIVVELTNDKKNDEGLFPLKDESGKIGWVSKQDYINNKLSSMSSKALFIKLLDMRSNLGDSQTLPEFVKRISKQVSYIDRHRETKFKGKLTGDHLLIIADIYRVLQDIYHEKIKEREWVFA